MMNQHHRSVNVKRTDLLLALHNGLDAHRKQYAEAVQDFRAKVLRDLKAKTKEVTKATDAQLVKVQTLHIVAPQNHEQEYLEMIDLFEVSIDEHINLDHQSFKSFFKNEWPWKQQFEISAMSYKA
jgi:hypothetical protein